MQKHHVVPVSLQCIHILPNGKVNEANLISVENDEHVLIHQTLNINYMFIRNFIMRNAFKFIKDEEYFEELYKIQSLYFQRLPFLSEKLQWLHANSIKKQCVVVNEAYTVHMDTHQNAEFLSPVEQFKFYHSIYFNILIQHSKELCSKL